MSIKKIAQRVDPSLIDKEGLDVGSVTWDDLPAEGVTEARRIIADSQDRNNVSYADVYTQEVRLKTAHKIIVRGGSVNDISRNLGITLSEANALRKELYLRLAEEVKSLDKNQVIGQALMFYDEVTATFMQMAAPPTNANDTQRNQMVGLRTRVEALRGALQAQSDKQRLLKEAGFYSTPFKDSAPKDERAQEANDLKDVMEIVIQGGEFIIEPKQDVVEEKPSLI